MDTAVEIGNIHNKKGHPTNLLIIKKQQASSSISVAPDVRMPLGGSSSDVEAAIQVTAASPAVSVRHVESKFSFDVSTRDRTEDLARVKCTR